MITVKEVKTRKEQKEFLNFPIDLYKGNPCFVPPLWADEMKMFKPGYVYSDCCDSVFYNAYRDGKVVGRIQGIIQRAANEKNDEKRVRFTRFDAIDDLEVSRFLFEAVEKWAVERGMDTACGPLGYSDLEREGLLIEGFDQLSTFEEQYNAPYYQTHLEALGYTKEVDWLEFQLYGPESEETLKEQEQLAKFIMKRYKLHFGPARNGKDFLKRYADGVFKLIDDSYDKLYGTVPFTDGMKKLMMDNFSMVISTKNIAVILDENDKVVCFGLAIPALAKALAGTHGKYTPGTLLKLLKAIKRPTAIDLCLIGVDPEYLNRGISTVFSVELMHMLADKRITHAETNLNLEDNWAILNQWKRFEHKNHKRRRSFVKKLV
ncbi:MAG: hypothetical protein IKR30_01550 [Bacteroidales bacterium]|nr:hypothetical protein [Bacteroidales bacterium]